MKGPPAAIVHDDTVGLASPEHPWLATVLPASARRFRAAQASLAEALRDAGADLVDATPEVEIASAGAIRGDAEVAIVSVEPPVDDGHRPKIVRAAERAGVSVQTRLAAARARRALAAGGYERVAVVPWDFRQSLNLAGAPAARTTTLSQGLPRNALVVGTRTAPGPTVLEAVLARAGDAAGRRLEPESVSVRPGFVLVVSDDSVLRVTIGPARSEITTETKALESLHGLRPPRVVGERVPALLASERCGLADWSLVQRVPGESPWPRPLPEGVVDDCIEFLVELHTLPGSDDGRASLAIAAEPVAAACRRALVPFVRRLAAHVDDRLAELPRGFGHGDFFTGNLLVDRARLAGVVDWDAGGTGRLPLVDLLHFRLHLEEPPKDTDWGPAVISRLLPWAREGGDQAGVDYLRRVGAPADPGTLEALVVAYWLERTAYQLRTHAVRRSQPRWIARNVDLVLEALAARYPIA